MSVRIEPVVVFDISHTPKYKIMWKSGQLFSNYYTRTDRRFEADWCLFAAVDYELAKKMKIKDFFNSSACILK